MSQKSIRINNNNNNNSSSNWNSASFRIFFEGWLVRQEHYLDELISAKSNIYEKNENDLKDLIERVLSHYQQYYEAKSLLAKEDVYILFSPIWFSSFELAFLWIAGFKPGLAIRIVLNSVDDLSEEQLQRMERLRLEIRVEENELEGDMARVQESLAEPPLSEMARRSGRKLVEVERRSQMMVDESSSKEEAIEMLKSSMKILVERADFLRLKITMKVVEILNPVQTVKLLVAAAQIQLRIRKWGFQRDAERRRNR
ncbi:Transcription factor TGA like domain [Macleaya cordata]|uniref:Transcription factor TGA like domain n=1 Tax=Macleaya cordata TaxID=56857 RepID=A0A200QU10_MACCD|nr:Transcription factor TGA like domain [Macleaya cordata]